jgi:hypothetical protein
MLDHVATTNDDRVGQTEHRSPGSLLARPDSAILICDCDYEGGGFDLGSKRPELRLSHPHFFALQSLRAEDEERTLCPLDHNLTLQPQ